MKNNQIYCIKFYVRIKKNSFDIKSFTTTKIVIEKSNKRERERERKKYTEKTIKTSINHSFN